MENVVNICFKHGQVILKIRFRRAEHEQQTPTKIIKLDPVPPSTEDEKIVKKTPKSTPVKTTSIILVYSKGSFIYYVSKFLVIFTPFRQQL